MSDMKRRTVSLVLLALLLLIPIGNLWRVTHIGGQTASASPEEAERMLDGYERLSQTEVQRRIDEVRAVYEENTRREGVRQSVENTIAAIERGEMTYRQVFRDVYLCGDSLMAVVYAYDLMNENHIMAQVSAHLSDLENLLPRIAGARPKVLILHYGINSISEKEGHARRFVNDYRALIRRIQEASPDTRIIVSLLFPVDTSVATAERFRYVGRYNEYLTEMCREEHVETLDSTPLFAACPNYYREDGIHLNKGFYVKYWFKYIMREMEIY